MDKTDILIVGSGAREHALAWKLSSSPRVGTIYVAPGNAGTESFCTNVDILPTNISDLAQFASMKRIGMTIVGPEEPLSLGIVDQFHRNGLRIFGPTKAAAQIETSKLFAKKLMEEARIPTAAYRSFTDAQRAHEYAAAMHAPMVVKASGLASGKGVVICSGPEEAHAAIDDFMIKKIHGESGATVVIEEFLEGAEFSVHVITDGVNYALFPSSQDHKRIADNDTGKNTGGMGVIASVPWVDPQAMLLVEKTIIQPLIMALGAKGLPYKGVLFPGIMLTARGPKVIELNARFGDPECEAYMRLLESDLLDLLDESVDGGIGTHTPRWNSGGTVNVVLAAAGYPDEPRTGMQISGIDRAEAMPNIVVFHGSTRRTEGIVSTGGRVLVVSSLGSPIEMARELAYRAVGEIHFEGMQFRSDIGKKSMDRGVYR